MTVDEIMELVFDYANQRKWGRTGDADPEHVRSAIESLSNDAKARDWQPIETAPKDDTAVLVYPGTWSGRSASIAKWCSDNYAKKPRPYWSRDDDLGRVTISREHQPTHWMHLPPPPLMNKESTSCQTPQTVNYCHAHSAAAQLSLNTSNGTEKAEQAMTAIVSSSAVPAVSQ